MFCIQHMQFSYLAKNTKLVIDRIGIYDPSYQTPKLTFFFCIPILPVLVGTKYIVTNKEFNEHPMSKICQNLWLQNITDSVKDAVCISLGLGIPGLMCANRNLRGK